MAMQAAASRQYWAVISSDDEAPAVGCVGPVVARARHLMLPDVSRFLRDNSGFFARAIVRKEADALVAALAREDIRAVVVAEAAIPKVSAALPLDKGRFTSNAFCFHMPGAPRGTETGLPCDRIALLVCGKVGASQRAYKVDMDTRIMYSRYGAHARSVRKDKIVEERVWRYLLDVVPADPGLPRLRMNALEFKFGSLGTRLFHTRAANFMALAGLFAASAPNARVDRSVELLLDDDPTTIERFASLEAYDNFVLWRATLAAM